MKLQKNKYYCIKINLFGRMEKYEGKILEINEEEFILETEENISCNALVLKLKDVIFAKEIDSQKIEKIHKISNKKKFTNLKPAELPKF